MESGGWQRTTITIGTGVEVGDGGGASSTALTKRWRELLYIMAELETRIAGSNLINYITWNNIIKWENH